MAAASRRSSSSEDAAPADRAGGGVAAGLPNQPRRLPLPPTLWIPLAPAQREPRALPPGTHVEAGAALCEMASAAGHMPVAPAAGTIGGVRRVQCLGAREAWAVELLVDPRSTEDAADNAAADAMLQHPSTVENSGPNAAANSADLPTLIDALRNAGVWSDRVASPDLIGQFNLLLRRPADTVLINALDSSGAAPLNAAICQAMPALIEAGAALAARLTRAGRLLLAAQGVVQSEPLGQTPLRLRALGYRIHELSNDYPQSDPTLLLYSVLNRRLRPGRLPVEQGVLLLDAAAAAAIGQAVLGYGTPARAAMRWVPLSVYDHSSRRTHFVLAAVGTALSHITQALGIDSQYSTLHAGDLLRNLPSAGDAIIAGGELAIHATAPSPWVHPNPCIRCGWCVESCPTRVHPAALLEAAQRSDPLLAVRSGLAACIECGICEHVCPSHLPLLGAIRTLREKGA